MMHMNMRCRFAVFFFVVLVICCACAESPYAMRMMNLEDCIERALERNPAVLGAREEVHMAKANVVVARAGFMPTIELQGMMNTYEKLRTVEFDQAIPFLPDTMTIDFTCDHQWGVTLIQPLFTGGRIWNTYRMSRAALEASLHEMKQVELGVLYQVKEAFYGLLLAEKLVELASQSVTLAESHLERTRARYEEGKATRFQLLRAQVEVSNLQPAVIRSQNTVRLSRIVLNNLLNITHHENPRYTGDLEFNPLETTLDKIISRAHKRRPSLLTLRQHLKAADYNIRTIQGKFLPTLLFNTSCNINSNDFSLNRDEWKKDYTGNLVLSIPLFRGGARLGELQEAKARRESLKMSVEGMENMITAEVTGVWFRLEEAREIIDSSSKGLEEAKESLHIAETSYEAGVVTSLEVMDARMAYMKAETNHYQAIHDYLVATAQLEKVSGGALAGAELDE
jgi:outer membrane protein TolC